MPILLVLWLGCGGGRGGGGIGGGTDAGPIDSGAPDAGSACGPEGAGPAAPCLEDVGATVDRVVDGDTIDVVVDGGGQERVRLLGVDAPETNEGACGSGATAWSVRRLPAGTHVTLSFDAECLDRYGRTLAYVHDDAGFVNAALVRQGMAEACPYDPNTTYAGWLECLAAEAEGANRGLWAIGCHRDPCFQ
jgi:micrococcal nuclease